VVGASPAAVSHARIANVLDYRGIRTKRGKLRSSRSVEIVTTTRLDAEAGTTWSNYAPGNHSK